MADAWFPSMGDHVDCGAFHSIGNCRKKTKFGDEQSSVLPMSFLVLIGNGDTETQEKEEFMDPISGERLELEVQI